jgi:RNA polymerase sigma factor (sigma-70 family)
MPTGVGSAVHSGIREPQCGERENGGVSRSFAQAFRDEYPPLHRYLRRRVGGALADDLAAETFATAYANWERFDKSRALRPWLYGIAANLLRHHWRKERRQLQAYARTGIDPAVEDLNDSLDRAAADASKRELADALADLGQGERDILLLHAWAGLTDSEIAEALSLPLGTVKSRLHRARTKLRNRLASSGQQRSEATLLADGELR